MPQFDVSNYTSQVFWLIVCLTFLIMFFRRVLIPRMEYIFEMRYLRLHDERKKIEILKGQIQSLRENKLHKIKDAQDEISRLIIQTKKDLEREKEAQIQKIDNEMQANIFEFQNQLKWKIQEAEQYYEHNIHEYADMIQRKMIAGDLYKQNVMEKS